MDDTASATTDEAETRRLLDKLKATSRLIHMLNFKDKNEESSIKGREDMWERLLDVKNNQLLDAMKKNAALQGQHKSKIISYEKKVESLQETINELKELVKEHEKQRSSYISMVSQQQQQQAAARPTKLSSNKTLAYFIERETQTDSQQDDLTTGLIQNYQTSDLSNQLTSSIEQEALSTIENVKNSLRELAMSLVNQLRIGNVNKALPSDVMSLVEHIKKHINHITSSAVSQSNSKIKEPSTINGMDDLNGNTKATTPPQQRSKGLKKDGKKGVGVNGVTGNGKKQTQHQQSIRSELPDISRKDSLPDDVPAEGRNVQHKSNQPGQQQQQQQQHGAHHPASENTNGEIVCTESILTTSKQSPKSDVEEVDKRLPHIRSSELVPLQNPPRVGSVSGGDNSKSSSSEVIGADISMRKSSTPQPATTTANNTFINRNQQIQKPVAKSPFAFAQEQRKSGRQLSNKSAVMHCDVYIREQWDRYDIDKSGFLCKNEFKEVYKDMEHFGIEQSDSQINTILERYRMLGDDKISFDEFSIIMLKLAAR